MTTATSTITLPTKAEPVPPMPRPSRPRTASASGHTFVHRLAGTGEAFFIYQAQEYHVGWGHIVGDWYAKPAAHHGLRPVTNGYRTADEAVGAIEGGEGGMS